VQFYATQEKTLEEEACQFYKIHQNATVPKKGREGKPVQIGKK
jgi:hypothetical protein